MPRQSPSRPGQSWLRAACHPRRSSFRDGAGGLGRGAQHAAAGPCSQEGQATAKTPAKTKKIIRGRLSWALLAWRWSSLTQIRLLRHGLTGSWDETETFWVRRCCLQVWMPVQLRVGVAYVKLRFPFCP